MPDFSKMCLHSKCALHAQDTSWLDVYLSDIPHVVYQNADPKDTDGGPFLLQQTYTCRMQRIQQAKRCPRPQSLPAMVLAQRCNLPTVAQLAQLPALQARSTPQ